MTLCPGILPVGLSSTRTAFETMSLQIVTELLGVEFSSSRSGPIEPSSVQCSACMFGGMCWCNNSSVEQSALIQEMIEMELACSSELSFKNVGPCFWLARSITCCGMDWSWLVSSWLWWLVSCLDASWLLWLSSWLGLLVCGDWLTGLLSDTSGQCLLANGSICSSSVSLRTRPGNYAQAFSLAAGMRSDLDGIGTLVSLAAAKMVMLTLAEVPFFLSPLCDKCSHGSHSSVWISSVFLWMQIWRRSGAETLWYMLAWGLHTYRCLGRGLHVEYHDVDTISEAAPSSHLVQSHVCQLVVQVGQHSAWHFATLHHWDLGSDPQWLGD